MTTTYNVTITKICRVNVQITLRREGKSDFSTTMTREHLPEGASVGDTISMVGEIVWESSRYGSKAHFEPMSAEQIAESEKAEEERKAANFARKAAQVLDELKALASDGFYADRKADYIRKLVGARYDAEIKAARETAETVKARREAEREAARRAEEAKYTHLALPAYSGFAGRPAKGQKLLHRGHAYEVVSSYYNREDGMSFGAMSEEWYSVKAVCIDDRADGKAMLDADRREREAAERERREQREWDELMSRIRREGTVYDGEPIHLSDIPGRDLVDTMDIYGGGYILRDAGSAIWLIVNNGADGDNWGHNNIITGGAGAYAFWIPADPAVSD